jgi:hypothetical protein
VHEIRAHGLAGGGRVAGPNVCAARKEAAAEDVDGARQMVLARIRNRVDPSWHEEGQVSREEGPAARSGETAVGPTEASVLLGGAIDPITARLRWLWCVSAWSGVLTAMITRQPL